MKTLMIKDLSMVEELSREAMAATTGGKEGLLKWFGLGFDSITEAQTGQECNNGICVPYQQEGGNY